MRKCCNTVSDEVASLALEVGWRRIFFTSKLQLQKLISRRRLKTEEQRGAQQVCDLENNEDSCQEESVEKKEVLMSEKEFHHSVTPALSSGSDTSSYIDPGSVPDSDTFSDSSESVPEHFLEDMQRLLVQTPAQMTAHE